MKPKILIISVVIIVLAAAGYIYISKDHRDIATASVDYTITSQDLAAVFQDNEEQAITTYLNTVIEVQGEVAAISGNVIELTSGISGQLQEPLTQDQKVNLGNKLKIKIVGRCIGYDSLLEEVRLDQAYILD